MTDIGDVLPAHGVELQRLSLVDLEVPGEDRVFREAIVDLAAHVRAGMRIAVACRGGLDRTGMTTGCLLREAGLDADTAIERVHVARRHTLTLPQQLRYVKDWPPG